MTTYKPFDPRFAYDCMECDRDWFHAHKRRLFRSSEYIGTRPDLRPERIEPGRGWDYVCNVHGLVDENHDHISLWKRVFG